METETHTSIEAHWQYFRLAKRGLSAAIAANERIKARDALSPDERWKITILELSELYGQYTDNVATAVIFAGLAAEAYINHFLAWFFDASEAAELDKLSMHGKWMIVSKLYSAKDITYNPQIFQQLSALSRARNKLVHFKSEWIEHSKVKTRDDAIGEAERLSACLAKAILELRKIEPEFEEVMIDYYVLGNNL